MPRMGGGTWSSSPQIGSWDEARSAPWWEVFSDLFRVVFYLITQKQDGVDVLI